jgi:hypothetical protein
MKEKTPMNALRNTTLSGLALALLSLPVIAQEAPLCPFDANGRIADVAYDSTAVFWRPIVEHERLTLSIHTPCSTIVKEFAKGETPVFDLREVQGETDGLYTWELRTVPVVDPEVRDILAGARAKGDLFTPLALQQKGLLPDSPYVESGSFSVIEGFVLVPSEDESRSTRAVASEQGADGITSVFAAATVLTNADGVIRNSLCVGFDCPNSPAFSDTTVLLTENNTRIKFDDTSTLSGFARNDWELKANSNNSGGGSFFSIVDCGESSGGGCAEDHLVVIEAGAPANALRVDNAGRLGLGTGNPVVEIHSVNGDTPTLRLQQDGSSGFAPQTWDVAGNETNFFVRDVTGGSQLPFRIQPGADSNSLFIASDNDVGMGTSSPSAALHVRRTNGTAKMFVDEGSGSAAQRTLLQLTNNGGTEFRMTDNSTSVTWLFQNTAGNFRFTDAGDAFNEFILTQDGDLTITGEITTSGSCSGGCDRVFSPGYDLPSIAEHAAEMLTNQYLPAVGPTAEDEPFNLSQKVGGMLNELEKAHIYIAELSDQIEIKSTRILELEERLARIERQLSSENPGPTGLMAESR